jgi:hypothetical protein
LPHSTEYAPAGRGGKLEKWAAWRPLKVRRLSQPVFGELPCGRFRKMRSPALAGPASGQARGLDGWGVAWKENRPFCYPSAIQTRAAHRGCERGVICRNVEAWKASSPWRLRCEYHRRNANRRPSTRPGLEAQPGTWPFKRRVAPPRFLVEQGSPGAHVASAQAGARHSGTRNHPRPTGP